MQTDGLRESGSRLGVCIVGCGAVTQAIHIPVLQYLRDIFDIVAVVDPDAALAEAVARQTGARSASELGEALAGGGVNVVAICSPAQFHAEQVIAACAAGVRAVLCEKPLALTVDDARKIGDAADATGVPVIVATMHAFDPAYVRAKKAWRPAHALTYVESTCFLPPNERFVLIATQPVQARTPAYASPVPTEVSAIFGLASHHIPLVRDLLGGVEQVVAARSIAPFGYDVTLAAHGAIARLVGLVTDADEPEWSLRAFSADSSLTARFQPSYVQAGSATVSVQGRGSCRQWVYDESGYEQEWRALAAAALSGDPASGALACAIDDVATAQAIVDVMTAREGAST